MELYLLNILMANIYNVFNKLLSIFIYLFLGLMRNLLFMIMLCLWIWFRGLLGC